MPPELLTIDKPKRPWILGSLQKEVTFLVAYKGPKVDSGEVTFDELAGGWHGMMCMVEEAHRRLNGDLAGVKVWLRDAGPGLGEIRIEMQFSWLDRFLDFLGLAGPSVPVAMGPPPWGARPYDAVDLHEAVMGTMRRILKEARQHQAGRGA